MLFRRFEGFTVKVLSVCSLLDMTLDWFTRNIMEIFDNSELHVNVNDWWQKIYQQQSNLLSSFSS